MSRRGEAGFTYLWLLFAVAGLGLLHGVAAEAWDSAARREREAELLFVGGQFARALHSYHERSPAAQKQYPLRLEELLEDRRFPEPRRHLRKLYRDPLARGAEWGLVKSGGRIVGVHSQSAGQPMRTHFSGRFAAFAGAQRYSEWVFGPEQAEARPPAGQAVSDAATSRAEAVPPEPAEKAGDACGAAYAVALRQCAAAFPADPPARLQRCNVEAAARLSGCRG